MFIFWKDKLCDMRMNSWLVNLYIFLYASKCLDTLLAGPGFFRSVKGGLVQKHTLKQGDPHQV